MSIKVLAFTLLLARVGSMFFIILVMRRQWRLMKLPIEPIVRRFRYTLFLLSVAIVLGNIVPLLIDIITLFHNTGRPANLRAISIAYAYSNALTSFVSSYLIWTLYRLASDEKEVTNFEKKALNKRVKARKG